VPQDEPCDDVNTRVDGAIIGDIDCSGELTAVDALLILRHVAGLLPSLPSGCPPVHGNVLALA
jgi:hypothetical protein